VSLKRSIVVFAMLPTLANAAPCTNYGAHTVTGTIHRVMFYGPPNFGESPKTDQKGFYPVLRLDHAMGMCASDPDGFSKGPVIVREMQMIFLGNAKFSKAWYGKHVEVGGDMFAAQNAFHQIKNIRVGS
jgi:hypothetical protein